MSVPCILFSVENTVYAVPASTVHMVDMIDAVTRVPNAPRWIDGLVSVRGQVVPVVNLRRRFGFETRPFDIESRLIVIDMEGRLVGLAVDFAREFLNLPLEDMEVAPESLKGPGNDALEGVLNLQGRLILFLNPARLLSGQDLNQLH